MTAIRTNFRSHTSPAAVAPPAATAGPVWALLFAFGTLGLGPAFFWAGKWANFVRRDRRFWLDVIAAVRPAATTHADASALDDLTRRISAPRIHPLICWLGTLSVAFFTFAAFGDRPESTDIWHALFYHRLGPYRIEHDNLEFARWVWHWGLFAIFIVQWYAVRSYAASIHELVRWTNGRAKKFGLPVARGQALKTGLFPWWLIVMGALVFNHAWWGIPMVMAAALARRYTGRSSEALRAAVSLQLDSKQAFPNVVGPDVRYCAGPGCGRRLPEVAKFCPRCGTANHLAPGVPARGNAA
jgi:hypothetical protein